MLVCCLSVNWNTSLNNESPVYSTRGQISQGANKPRGESERTGGKSAKGRTSQGANEPEGEQAKGRISQAQGANKPGAKEPEGESARGRTSQGENKPGSESARGERARGEQARGEPAKGRKSHNSLNLLESRYHTLVWRLLCIRQNCDCLLLITYWLHVPQMPQGL